ncbi:MAG: menaquinone biosynthesis decarboxylase [Armatimonadota bacterium]|nr:menaquinone biosynthesis decarboxylase [Armatimonadota bacterium]
MYKDLRDYIARLEREGELKRITQPVDPVLEITEIADRVVKAAGPALLFEKPVGSEMAVLINAMGSDKRIAMALGVNDVAEIAVELEETLRPQVGEGIIGKLRMLPTLAKLAGSLPKTVKSAPCQEVVREGEKASLAELPILQCWPEDGGRFITLPMVITKDPHTGIRNVGMYRMHVYDERTTGMHWHAHKVGARHYREYQRLGRRMDVAVALGGDPAITYSATAPLPEDFDEMIFAGFLRKKAVEMVQCKTVDLQVPAESEIVIEGYVDPDESRMEGPFGDHTGYYSPADMYPVFHVTCITSRKDPIYPATIVGKPPMEDCYLATATVRIFLPLIKMQLPEIVDMWLPPEGVFHNLAIVAIKKGYPRHAQKVMHALWGLGQMMFTKIIVVVDEDVNPRDMSEVIWRLGNNIDPQRDVTFVEGPVDVLNHASPTPNYGSKMGIDATKKWKSEGFEREWPADIKMSPEVVARIDGIWRELGLG